MMMRGDMEKLFNKINPVFETAFNRIDALVARVDELEKDVKLLQDPTKEVKRGPGRPKKAA